MPDPSVFDLIMGSPEDLRQRSNENFEHQCIKQFLRGFGMPPKQLSRLERDVKGFTCAWFEVQYPQFEVDLYACRVRDYSVQELFERPTASPVMAAFVERFGTGDLERPGVLLFKAAGWTKLTMSRGADWLTDRHNYLNLCVHGTRYRVCPLEELIDAYPSRFLEAKAVQA